MEKLTYITPDVEVVEIKLEKGFAQSGGLEDPTLFPGSWQ